MGKTAFIFPGQGAQKAGMGKDFYENSSAAREIYDTASELLHIDMKELCFEKNDRLDLTEYTQAALVTTCLAMARELESRGVKADVTAGLSLGEYCAIAVAGGMEAGAAITTVRKRGIFMQEAVPAGVGAMAAVWGMDEDEIEKALVRMGEVWIANYNCPGQIVIAGKREAVEAANARLLENGAKRAMMLNVSGPFHTPLLEEAGKKLSKVLELVSWQELNLPYVANVTAGYVTDIGETKRLLTAQVVSSVRWQQSMEAMIADGVDTFVEIGPGKTLAGFLKKINREVRICSVGSWEAVEKAVVFTGV